MKIVCVCALAVAVMLIGGCSSGESYVKAGYDFTKLDKVAVVDVQGDINGELAKNQIADFFAMELLKKGFAPVERVEVQALLKEQQFQTSGLTSPEGAARAGKILNVPAILVVNIPNFGEEISMTAKMINVEDGGILWMGSGSGKTGKTLSTIFGAAAGAGAGAAAGAAAGGNDSTAIGAVAGGVLGGVTGHELSPQKAEKTQEIIKKICDRLPSRLPK
ncbi:MAG: hypothetical protein NTX52_09070 [Planctomycetota bacterium]|nr:hypothetical protein [Planctomycetota bacterium]